MKRIIDAHKWIGLGRAAVLCIAGIAVAQASGATTGNL
jgi:hypothetical protein